jgi:hypothetical protein
MLALDVLLALLTAIPVLKSWFDQLVADYISFKIESMKQENRDAIRKALDAFDQRDLEKAIGNPNPGAPSNLDGVEYVTDLPGVHNSPGGPR